VVASRKRRPTAKDEPSPVRAAIIQEWDAWAKKHPDRTRIAGGVLFFNYLQKKRADLLLDFKSSGDKWETVHAWLFREGKVNRAASERAFVEHAAIVGRERCDAGNETRFGRLPQDFIDSHSVSSSMPA
jgi:hypothetical protein